MSNVPPPPPGSPRPSGSPPPPPPPGPGGPPPGSLHPPPGGPPPPPPGGYGQAPGYGQPYAAAPQRELAGFWIRFGGWLLDGLLYGLVFVPFMIAGIALFAAGFDECVTINDEIVCNGQEDAGPILGGVLVMLAGVIVMVFLFLRALAKTGQTWGSKLVGIKVIRIDNGSAPGWGKAIGRSLFSYISGWVFYLGYLWMIWDDENQTWQDKVAGTYVVRV